MISKKSEYSASRNLKKKLVTPSPLFNLNLNEKDINTRIPPKNLTLQKMEKMFKSVGDPFENHDSDITSNLNKLWEVYCKYAFPNIWAVQHTKEMNKLKENIKTIFTEELLSKKKNIRTRSKSSSRSRKKSIKSIKSSRKKSIRKNANLKNLSMRRAFPINQTQRINVNSKVAQAAGGKKYKGGFTRPLLLNYPNVNLNGLNGYDRMCRDTWAPRCVQLGVSNIYGMSIPIGMGPAAEPGGVCHAPVPPNGQWHPGKETEAFNNLGVAMFSQKNVANDQPIRITKLLCLEKDCEKEGPMWDELLNISGSIGEAGFHLIEDMNAGKPGTFRDIRRFLIGNIGSNKTIYNCDRTVVHCLAGMGRTSSILLFMLCTNPNYNCKVPYSFQTIRNAFTKHLVDGYGGGPLDVGRHNMIEEFLCNNVDGWPPYDIFHWNLFLNRLNNINLNIALYNNPGADIDAVCLYKVIPYGTNYIALDHPDSFDIFSFSNANLINDMNTYLFQAQTNAGNDIYFMP